VLEQLELLPRKSVEAQRRSELVDQLPADVQRLVPALLDRAIQLLVHLLEPLQHDPARRQRIEELRGWANALITFAQLLNARLPADTASRLMRADMLLQMGS